LIGTAGDIGKIPIRQIKDSALARQLEGIRTTYAEDLDRMRTTVGPDGKPLIDPKSYHYFAKSLKDVNSGVIDVLAGFQVYDAAKMNDPGGRLSDADREAAAEQVGVRGFSPTLDRERARGREDEFISQIESDLDFDFKRLERMSSEKNPATIRREDVGIGGGEPGVKLTPEQQEMMNSLLGGSR
jgi:hypothetical protein